MRNYLLYLGLILSAQSYACDDALTKHQRELLQYILHVDSKYSETLHEEFWSPWKMCTLTEKNDKSRELFEIVQKGIKGQKAKYQSALLSISAGKPTYSEGYIEYIESKEHFNQAKGFRNEKINQEKRQTDEFLNAAVTGAPIVRNGKVIYINETIINEVLAGLDGNEKKLKLFLSPPLPK